LEDLELDGRAVLIRTFKKWNGVWTGLVWFSIRCFECSIEI
jgi:hypothetical protein